MKISKYKGILLTIAVVLYFGSALVEKPLSIFEYLLIALGSVSFYSVIASFIMKGTVLSVKGKAKTAVIITTIFFFVLEIIEKVVFTVNNPSSVRIKIFPPFLPGLLLVVYICELKAKEQSLKTPKRVAIIAFLAIITAVLLVAQITSIFSR